jgi:hypothetical protein
MVQHLPELTNARRSSVALLEQNFSRWLSMDLGKKPGRDYKYKCGVNSSGKLDYRYYGGRPEMDLNFCAYAFSVVPGEICPYRGNCFWRGWAPEYPMETRIDKAFWDRVRNKQGGFKGDWHPPDHFASNYEGPPKLLRTGAIVLGPNNVRSTPEQWQRAAGNRSMFDSVQDLTNEQKEELKWQISKPTSKQTKTKGGRIRTVDTYGATSSSNAGSAVSASTAAQPAVQPQNPPAVIPNASSAFSSFASTL